MNGCLAVFCIKYTQYSDRYIYSRARPCRLTTARPPIINLLKKLNIRSDDVISCDDTAIKQGLMHKVNVFGRGLICGPNLLQRLFGPYKYYLTLPICVTNSSVRLRRNSITKQLDRLQSDVLTLSGWNNLRQPPPYCWAQTLIGKRLALGKRFTYQRANTRI